MGNNDLATIPHNQGEQVQAELGAVAVSTRETAVIQSLVVLACQRPRDINTVIAEITAMAKRPTFAEKAHYAYPRGGNRDCKHQWSAGGKCTKCDATRIKGASVVFARSFSTAYGNIYSALQILQDDGEWIHIQAVAIDLQKNNTKMAEAKFKNLILRGGKWIKPDERDKRELVARQGAFCERNVLLKLFPGDLVEDALNQCDATVEGKHDAGLKTSKSPAYYDKHFRDEFDKRGVSVSSVEAHIGKPLSDFTKADFTVLTQIINALRDGQAKVSEYFGGGEPEAPAPATTGTLNLENTKAGTPPVREDNATIKLIHEVETMASKFTDDELSVLYREFNIGIVAETPTATLSELRNAMIVELEGRPRK